MRYKKAIFWTNSKEIRPECYVRGIPSTKTMLAEAIFMRIGVAHIAVVIAQQLMLS